HSASATLVVSASSPGAAYDASFKAPRCASNGSRCDSGTLLNGRATLGPEPNTPNTINGSCTDGGYGAYHSDESLDALIVSTSDGTNLAAGKTVTVEAHVWAWSTGSADHLDLYYAANASSPSWILVGTTTPTHGGANTLTATYTLPAGANQAIRGVFR